MLFATYTPSAAAAPLANLVSELTAAQATSWPRLSAARAVLPSMRSRTVHCNGFSVRLQFNPRRIVSSVAKVDQVSIQERPCFLCVANLPEPQRGILYRKDFLVLCNPAPIFSQHYTVSHTAHTAQLIDGYVGTFLHVARDLGPRYTVFYNGPKCGASAPDHLHFQVCPSGVIPIEKDVCDKGRRTLETTIGGVSVVTLSQLGRGVIVLEGAAHAAVAQVTRNTIAAAASVVEVAEEPMVNLLCTHTDDIWRVIIFPRRKHRPDVYFRAGQARVLISPATVDIGGLIITPVEHDFMRVDAQLVEEIFHEVCVSEENARRIVAQL
jgi:hypothetical protein